MPKTNIKRKHKDAFNAIRNPEFNNFVLFSCFVDGKPTTAICALNQTGEEYQISPLFIAVTKGMKLSDHDGVTI